MWYCMSCGVCVDRRSFVACKQSTTIVLRFQICLRKQRACNSLAWMNLITLGNVNAERFSHKPKNTGCSNLFAHIKSQYPKENLCDSSQSKISIAPTVTKKSSNIYGWLNWVCSSLKPFSFVEDELNREYSKLEPISVNSLKKYLGLVTKEFEKRIAAKITEKIFDGWSKQSTHFVDVFAAILSNDKNEYETILLSFLPLASKTSFAANDHYEQIEWTLVLYSKSLGNVVALIGDNASVNKSLSNLCNKPLTGCASHRFNLAVKKFLETWQTSYRIDSCNGQTQNQH